VGLERGPLSLARINEEQLEKKVAAAVKTTEIIDMSGFRHDDHATPLYPQNLAVKFANQWRSLSRYSSLAD
jgi:hypothetical protein